MASSASPDNTQMEPDRNVNGIAPQEKNETKTFSSHSNGTDNHHLWEKSAFKAEKKILNSYACTYVYTNQLHMHNTRKH